METASTLPTGSDIRTKELQINAECRLETQSQTVGRRWRISVEIVSVQLLKNYHCRLTDVYCISHSDKSIAHITDWFASAINIGPRIVLKTSAFGMIENM